MVNHLSCGAEDKFGRECGGVTNAIPVDVIKVSTDNHRKLDEKSIQELQSSIEVNGLLAPIGVKRSNTGGYDLIYGRHRYEAWARKFKEAIETQSDEAKARWHKIPANIYERHMTDEACKLMELTENLVRNDLSKKEKEKLWGNMLKLRGNYIEVKESPKITMTAFGEECGFRGEKKIVSNKIGRLWTKFKKEKKFIDTSWPQPGDFRYRAFWEWLVERGDVKGSWAQEMPFDPKPVGRKSDEGVPLGRLHHLRDLRDYSKKLNIPKTSIENKWKQFNEATEQNLKFQTCSEEKIDEFADWLANPEAREEAKKQKKTYQEKVEEVSEAVEPVIRRYLKNKTDPKAILEALESLIEKYKTHTIYGV